MTKVYNIDNILNFIITLYILPKIKVLKILLLRESLDFKGTLSDLR